MLSGIPRDLWDLFIPKTVEELVVLEARIMTLRGREEKREQGMTIQMVHKLPLRPNLSLRETVINARIQQLKSKRNHNHGKHKE